MLRLRLDTTYLDLPPDAALTLTVHNPLFDPDGAEALYSFPFTLPATPRNLETLSHASRLDSSNNTTTYTNAVLEIEGVPFDNGVLELDEQKFTREGIGAIYRNAVPELLDELEKIKIHEILETVAATYLTPKSVWKFDLTISPPNTYAITIDGSVITYNAGAGETSAQIVTGLSANIDAVFPAMSYNPPGNTQLQLESAQVNLHPVGLFSLVGLSLVSVVTTGQARQTGFQNRVAEVNATPVDSHAWPMLFWLNFYQGSNRRKFTSYINAAVGGNFIENQPYADPAWETTFVPFVKLPYIFARIAANTALVSTWAGYFDDTDIQQLLVFNNRAVDELIEDIYEEGDDTKFINGFQLNIDLNRHVPEMTARELLSRFLSAFALWYDYTGTTITFYKKQDQLDDAPIDWTHLTEPGYTATRNRREGFTLDYQETEDQYTDPAQLQPYTYGDGKDDIELPFHTLNMTSRSAYVVAANLKLPILNQAGSSTEGGLGDNDFSFRLLFDRGMQPASNSQTYRYGSHDYSNYAGSAVGSLSLDLNDASGLYHQNHKSILKLLSDGQPVTLPMRLGIHHILDARKWENSRRTIKLEDGHVTAVIKSIQFRATPDGIGISIVEFVQEK